MAFSGSPGASGVTWFSWFVIVFAGFKWFWMVSGAPEYHTNSYKSILGPSDFTKYQKVHFWRNELINQSIK